MNNEEKIFWISGSFYYCTKVLQDIKLKIGNHSLFKCDNEEFQLKSFENDLLSSDMLYDAKKIFIFTEIPAAKNSTATNKNFIQFLEQVKNSDNSYVIIFGIEETKKPTIFKYVKENGKVMSYQEYLSKDKAVEFVSNRISKNIEPEAIQYIIDSIGIENNKGINTDRLYNSVNKIISYLGKERNITKEIVFKVSDKYNNIISFDLFDAIDKRDYTLCQKLLYKLCEKNGIKEGITGLFFTLLWRYRLIFLLKEILKDCKKVGYKEEQEAISGIMKLIKLKREGVNEFMHYSPELDDNNSPKSNYSKNALNSVIKGFYGKTPDINKYNRKDAYKAIVCVQKALSIIHALNDVECLLLADNFFMTMCNLLDYKQLLEMREIYIGD